MEQAKFCVCEACEAEFSNQQNRCQSCAYPINGNLDFCGQCLNHSPVFNRAYTLYDYQDLVAQLIKSFKYSQQLCIGDYFAHKLADKYQLLQDYDAIIPMPLSCQRIRERGFNQVLELLSVIKKKPQVIVDTHSIKRIKATQSLESLNPEQRQKEVKGAFYADLISYQRVLLVDDVMTTGASLNELAKTVIKAGAKTCDVLTLSRAKF
ncbi:Competence protein F homolog, phosphoribosyltransferase domain; protein YhgH required for utilization of DNA as sole source of carbon and energy [Bathymodiolus heckerae thiotrophic gill symbiont]|uniref:ComF family protein n=1 Tax=Bathymodiolus heckerae thiotrophic gill symbiont TaxID=1052212 RepID=UPI0010B0A756|nr:ComF family protein [Bathymodiolus heckerae thiotrophic gill symbiont]SMN13771.1 Competence protein F homolog, phosphoribosyltransferase domain; protein YhgH required for utilization of DNA as sole source of carbon and energy [Bathymodiolus heckerae thiotrophic gill symbiont]SMN15760.1 Competence protein F homolog, phosphoribosyltransferase domain; protein YhgH required for utilization of DNA as sole source of carbon and energy [uncultured Candidatus Thioglobus sp.]